MRVVNRVRRAFDMLTSGWKLSIKILLVRDMLQMPIAAYLCGEAGRGCFACALHWQAWLEEMHQRSGAVYGGD